MAEFGFCGGSYTLPNVTADAQRAINLFCEADESQEGKSALTMLGTPGLKVFFNDPNQSSGRALVEVNGRVFAILGTAFIELFAVGAPTYWGQVAADNGLASIATGPNMLLIASGGACYTFTLIDVNSSVNQQIGTGILPATQLKTGSVLQLTDGISLFSYTTKAGDTLAQVAAQLNATPYFTGQIVGSTIVITALSGNDITISTNTLTDANTGLQAETFTSTPVVIPANTFAPLPSINFGGSLISKVGWCDGFFLALVKNSNTFYVSDPEDATHWDQNGNTTISVISDNSLSMFVDHRQPWFFGPHESQPYYDSGNLFPFDPVPGAFIEQGIGAADSVAQLDNSLFWLGSSDRGPNIAFRANGYAPQRISNHACENEWNTYATTADARGWSYVDGGHSFYVLYFPTANKTWVYDVATNLWHERDRWKAESGISIAFPGQCHVYAFGMHLIGDWSSGTIYQMSLQIFDDNGGPIRRVRRAPYISTEQEWITYSRLQVDMQVGIGPMPPLTDQNGNPREPQAILNWSNDGAQTWSNELIRGCGLAGDFLKRVIWRRLGKARSRVFQFVMTDPVPIRITAAYLKAKPGFTPQERLAKSYLKIT